MIRLVEKTSNHLRIKAARKQEEIKKGKEAGRQMLKIGLKTKVKTA